MKVLSIIHATQPGGVQRVGAVETTMLNKFGYETLLVSILKTHEWGIFKELGIKPIYLFNSEAFGRLISGLFFKININTKPDIIIAHNNPCAQVAFKLKRKLEKESKNTPVIFYLHDSLVYPIAGSLFGEILRIFPQIFKKLEYKHLKESEIVLVNSEVSLNRVMRNHCLKNLSEKISILYPTTNMPIPKDRVVRDKEEYILIVGRMDHEASYNIYKIMKILDYPLIVAGYGHPYNPKFKKVLKLFKILMKKGKDIKIIFSPSDTQLIELYRTASLFIYPGHENFNMSAIEAMSAGCPILVADTSGVCEILPQKLREELCMNKNNIKLWVERIQEIIRSDKSYELGKKCWKVTHRYNLNTHIDKLIRILREVILDV